MIVTGIVGTAKNTGKTTTLAALLEEAARRSEPVGLTGIGYDGEEIDTVTGLPKPRLLLQQGTVAATSEACLRSASARFRVIKETATVTALGRVSIVEVTEPGLLVLAGPNTRRLLERLLEDFSELGITRVFVDGSLNRIAAISAADSVVFTTGASRSPEIGFLAEEARSIIRLFGAQKASHAGMPERVSVLGNDGDIRASLSAASLYDRQDAEDAARLIDEHASSLVIPKMVSLSALEYLAQRIPDATHAKGCTVILHDPTTLLLAGEPLSTWRVMETAGERGVSFAYHHPIAPRAMTVNPFYPLKTENAFVPAYIDKNHLLHAVRESAAVPVFNIREEGAAAHLYELLL